MMTGTRLETDQPGAKRRSMTENLRSRPRSLDGFPYRIVIEPRLDAAAALVSLVLLSLGVPCWSRC